MAQSSRAAKKRWADANKEKVRAINAAWREKVKNTDAYKSRRAAWWAANKDRTKEVNSAWSAANAERKAEINKVWQQSNPERVLATAKAYQRRHPEKVRARAKQYRDANPELRKARKLEWNNRNPHKNAAYCVQRKARRLSATPAWADLELIDLVYAEANHRGEQVDHIVPLQGKNVCGLHVHYNMQLLSQSENDSKGNRFPYPPKIPLEKAA